MGVLNLAVEDHAMRVLHAVLLLRAVAVAEDKPKTFKEVKVAVESGDKDSQRELGILYGHGRSSLSWLRHEVLRCPLVRIHAHRF